MDSSPPRSVALLSIHPCYADRILSGEKCYEFRRTTIADSVRYLVVYATSPVQRVVAYCEVTEIMRGAPSTLWRKCRDGAGINRRDFNEYYRDCKQGVAICFSQVHPIVPSLKLDRLAPNLKPPQCLKYMSEEVLEQLGAVGRAA